MGRPSLYTTYALKPFRMSQIFYSVQYGGAHGSEYACMGLHVCESELGTSVWVGVLYNSSIHMKT
jgi:hypothetical protein